MSQDKSVLGQPPVRAAMVHEDSNVVTGDWSRWLTSLYNRIGGVNAPSNVTAGNFLVSDGAQWNSVMPSGSVSSISPAGAFILSNAGATAGTYNINGINFFTINNEGRISAISNISLGQIAALDTFSVSFNGAV